jgi:hypothetical protein
LQLNYQSLNPLSIHTMSAINRGVRTVASKNLRVPFPANNLQSRALQTAPLRSLSSTSRSSPRTTQIASRKQFSTMSPLQSGAPPPPQAREYDPEIKDIASYVHNTPIDSDLAVRSPKRLVKAIPDVVHSLIPRGSSCSTP